VTPSRYRSVAAASAHLAADPRRCKVRWLFALAATLGLLLMPSGADGNSTEAGAPTAASFGIFEDVQYLTGRTLGRRLDAYAALGAHWVRFQMIWGSIQHASPSEHKWGHYDALVRAIVARGMKPLAVLGTTPAWARSETCAEELTCAPSDPADFARFAGDAAARYSRRGLHHWEIWNEPNSAIFWKPHPDPVAYTALLRATYPAIKAADSRSVVISGGLASVGTVLDPTGPATINPVEFLLVEYENGAAGTFDALGVHPYTFPFMPGDTNGYGWRVLGHGTPSIRSLMSTYGDAEKELWATEFGAPTALGLRGGVSDAAQAKSVRKAYAIWARKPWAGPLIWYSFRDRGGDTSDRENFFGLVRADGTRKPAYFTYQRAAATAGSIHAAKAILWQLRHRVA
jgi:polysaccharide biosynthesis protein PslG